MERTTLCKIWRVFCANHHFIITYHSKRKAAEHATRIGGSIGWALGERANWVQA